MCTFKFIPLQFISTFLAYMKHHTANRILNYRIVLYKICLCGHITDYRTFWMAAIYCSSCGYGGLTVYENRLLRTIILIVISVVLGAKEQARMNVNVIMCMRVQFRMIRNFNYVNEPMSAICFWDDRVNTVKDFKNERKLVKSAHFV